MNTNPAELKQFLATYKPAFPVGIVDVRYAMDYAQVTPGMRPTVPIMFFIDAKGVIRAQYFGTDAFFKPENQMGARIREQINKLLQNGAPIPKKKTAPRKSK
jgi:hypothetical protein